MKILYDLVSINIANKATIELLVKNKKNSALIVFFNLLFDENSRDEDEIKFKLFGSLNKPSEFSKLKSTMKNILLKCLSLHEIPWEENDSRLNEFHKLYNNYLGIVYLYDSKRFLLGIKLLEYEIIKAIRYEFSDLVVNMSKILVSYYGSDQYNEYKFKKYLQLFNEYAEIYKYELLTIEYYVVLQKSQSESLSNTNSQYKKLAEHYIDNLKKLSINSFNYNYNKYRIELIYFEFNRDYESILSYSTQLLEKYDNRFITKTKRGNVNIRMMWALIQAGKYNQSIIMGIETLRTIQKHNSTYFSLSYYTIKAYLYQGLYNDAIEFISDSFRLLDFKYLSGIYFEVINLTLGYCHLIIESGMVDRERILRKLPPFRISKFLNEIPNYSKDKRGINVSILLMHITFLLQKKDYGKIIDRVDALKFYAYRHLRRDDTYRSNCMIKMVIQMAKADFHPVRTERYTEDLFRQLQEVKLAGSGQNIETEIIPYEVLWDIMKKALK